LLSFLYHGKTRIMIASQMMVADPIALVFIHVHGHRNARRIKRCRGAPIQCVMVTMK
jgi:hypothetical protein